MTYRASYPATAGELVQGLVGGVHVHVSAPIECFSTASYVRDSAPFRAPAGKTKAVGAANLLFQRLSVPATGILEIDSRLPAGKGLGTSTADIGATVAAIAAAFGISLSDREIAEIALEVEPTDGSLFPGIVLFDHRGGLVLEYLGPAPAVAMLVVDTGGMVETLLYNEEINEATLARNEAVVIEAIELVRKALQTGDIGLLGRASTLSAFAHQTILPKPGLEEIYRIGRSHGAIGVAVGHSGSVCTLLFEPESRTWNASEDIRQALGFSSFPTSLRGGGMMERNG